jgi:hypothetical protein
VVIALSIALWSVYQEEGMKAGTYILNESGKWTRQQGADEGAGRQ